MNTSRDVLRAALTWFRGEHPHARLAQAAFARAGVDRLSDPVVIALALGYLAVPIMSLSDRWRAELRGTTIRYRWDPDHTEDRLNILYGIALALLREAGNPCPTPTQVWGMTLATALPDDAPELWEAHPHVPRWLVELRISAKRADSSSGGMRISIARG
jgi:hypothetical protein